MNLQLKQNVHASPTRITDFCTLSINKNRPGAHESSVYNAAVCAGADTTGVDLYSMHVVVWVESSSLCRELLYFLLRFLLCTFPCIFHLLTSLRPRISYLGNSLCVQIALH